MLQVGDVLRNRYKIEAFLGRGGMADVYLATDLRRQVNVAIKVLREDLAEDPEFVQRFRREAEALARLDHPYVVRFYSFERQERLAFIVMDYVAGSTLRARLLDAGGPLPLAETTQILRQVGSALQYAHNEGYVHRDIKPGNILIREDGTALLSDFGIARAAETATMTMGPIGAPAYMSPEQISGREPTAQTDIYSLGIVLYEMVTGRRPFSGEGGTGSGTMSRMKRIQQQHLREAPPDPKMFNPQLPAAAAAVILQALEKRPEARWKSVMDMVRAWEDGLGVEHQSAVGGRAVGNRATQRAVITPTGSLPPAKATVEQAQRKRPLWMQIAVVIGVAVIVLFVMRSLLPAGSAETTGQTVVVQATTKPTASEPESPPATPDIEATAEMMAHSYATATAAAEATINAEVEERAAATAQAIAQTATAEVQATLAEQTIEAQVAQSIAATATASYRQTATAKPRPTATRKPPTATPTPSTPVARINTDNLNVRTGPGTSYGIVTKLKAGTEVLIIGQNGDWWQIRLSGGKAGWVHEKYVSASGALSRVAKVSAPPTPTPPPIRCFEARRRHWEKSPAGAGEIAGIVYDANGRPFSRATAHLYIKDSNWSVNLSIAPDGIYHHCCLAYSNSNLHVIELIGVNIRTVQTYEFYINNLDLNKVLVDFYEVPCR